MKVIFYDSKPGKGFWQWLLKMSWVIGAYWLKLTGKVNKVKGISQFEDILDFFRANGAASELQYWGHGSPGTVWISENPTNYVVWGRIKGYVTGLIWFRCCSVFNSTAGFIFAARLVERLGGATVAAHTRTIGLRQGGLHTIKPGQHPYWSVLEGIGSDDATPPFYLDGKTNAIWCFGSKIPEGW